MSDGPALRRHLYEPGACSTKPSARIAASKRPWLPSRANRYKSSGIGLPRGPLSIFDWQGTGLARTHPDAAP